MLVSHSMSAVLRQSV